MRCTGREARILLGRSGMGDRQARQALAAGLAGQPGVVGASHEYDRAAVLALAGRKAWSPAELGEHCSRGWFVARRPDAARREASRAEQIEALSRGWEAMSIWTRIALRIEIETHGPVPFLATVAGCVYLGADLVGVEPGCRLVLAQPGPWFTALREARVVAGPGRPWVVWLPGDLGHRSPGPPSAGPPHPSGSSTRPSRHAP